MLPEISMLSLPFWVVLAGATLDVLPRTVSSLDESAAGEAQQRDNTATRVFSNVQIKTADGRCLFVDKLSGDFRENLTPVQITTCGSTDGQGWDIITAGKHIDVANSVLIVSTLTQACFNFDPRRVVGNQVILFSCGGRADGGGDVTSSQLFSFNATAGPLSLEPENASGTCLAAKANVVDSANCDSSDSNQLFVFGTAAISPTDPAGVTNAATTVNASSLPVRSSTAPSQTSDAIVLSSQTSPGTFITTTLCRSPRTVTITTTIDASAPSQATNDMDLGASIVSSSESSASVASSLAAVSSTTATTVSRGGTLNPSAAAEANPKDDTATRVFSSVEIRDPNGHCLSIDPAAGDFRQNLIPVNSVDCSGSLNEKWDVVTAGRHNNVNGTALIISSLTNGCISFDSRRATNDTVNLFSCGGRADGGGQTNADQLIPFNGALSFALAPSGEKGGVCLLPGGSRLVSGTCPTNGAQLFSLFP